MSLLLTQGGSEKILNTFFGGSSYPKPANMYLELFTDSGALSNTDQGSGRELATGGGYAEIDLTTLDTAAGLSSGIGIIEWMDAVFTFTGPLTNSTNKTIKGYIVLADNVVIFEELLPGSGFTPANSGDTLTIALQFKLGNGTPTP